MNRPGRVSFDMAASILYYWEVRSTLRRAGLSEALTNNTRITASIRAFVLTNMEAMTRHLSARVTGVGCTEALVMLIVCYFQKGFGYLSLDLKIIEAFFNLLASDDEVALFALQSSRMGVSVGAPQA